MSTAGPGPCHVIAGMNSASRGRRLTGTVTKNNLGFRAPVARDPPIGAAEDFGPVIRQGVQIWVSGAG